MTLIPEKIADAGENTCTITTLKRMFKKLRDVVGLTRPTTLVRTRLVERAYKQLMTGSRHLINLGSPFLKSENALACSRTTTRTDSADVHASIFEVSG